jgi:hypothetical protein
MVMLLASYLDSLAVFGCLSTVLYSEVMALLHGCVGIGTYKAMLHGF